ncbi:hypothetical protein BXO88_13970 [Oribacterium sp. C9]|uniref:hypothetical protein n=1 Tax=Oribacterium sp. C9 TaxID=1943579 RepID=UPI00098F5CA3|nr:hypothetical protein [Oribacterium sp. C9]OON85089.1 hypothetical protein BXO88_13970 [Oribacterium sp. C9]
MKKMNLIKRIVATGTVAALSVSMLAGTAIAAGFKSNEKGIWYENDDQSYPKSVWKWIDKDGDGKYECYAFDENGYAYVSTTTPDGYTTDAEGAWVKNGTKVLRDATGDLSDNAITASVANNSELTKDQYLNKINSINGVTETVYGVTSKDTTMQVKVHTTSNVSTSEIVTSKHSVKRTTSEGGNKDTSGPDMSQTSFDTNGPSVPAGAGQSSAAPLTDTTTIGVVGPDGTVDPLTD